MTTIFKYPLIITDEQILELPLFSQILSVKFQRGELFLWAKVNTDSQSVKTKIFIYGTGNPIRSKSKMKFVDTVMHFEDSLVWHVFKEIL